MTVFSVSPGREGQRPRHRRVVLPRRRRAVRARIVHRHRPERRARERHRERQHSVRTLVHLRIRDRKTRQALDPHRERGRELPSVLRAYRPARRAVRRRRQRHLDRRVRVGLNREPPRPVGLEPVLPLPVRVVRALHPGDPPARDRERIQAHRARRELERLAERELHRERVLSVMLRRHARERRRQRRGPGLRPGRGQVRTHRHLLTVKPGKACGGTPGVRGGNPIMFERRVRRKRRTAEVEHRAVRHAAVLEVDQHFWLGGVVAIGYGVLDPETPHLPTRHAVRDLRVFERTAVAVPETQGMAQIPPAKPCRQRRAPVGVGTLGGTVLRRRHHHHRRTARQLLLRAEAVGERHLHPDRIADIRRHRRVGLRRRVGNVRLRAAGHAHPLEAVVVREGSRQAVGIGNLALPRRQHLADLGNPLDHRIALGGVGHLKHLGQAVERTAAATPSED